jgi:hypothetical protein
MQINKAITDTDYILGFMRNESPDYKGRKYLDMINWTDQQLESCHDQIQHMFPLHEESRMAVRYPIITKEIAEIAENDSVIQNNMMSALWRMRRVFGIGEYNDKNIQYTWCQKGNHNLLRITRIIRSLRIFGLDNLAENFYGCVIDAMFPTGKIDLDWAKTTIKYWNKAYQDDVWEPLQNRNVR